MEWHFQELWHRKCSHGIAEEQELSDSEVTPQKMTEGFWKGQQELLMIAAVGASEDKNGNVVLIWFHVIHLFFLF